MKKNPYHSLPGVSSHMLGWVLPEDGGSPEMFRYFNDNPPAELDASAVLIGTALHKFIEAPDKFVAKIIDMPGPKLKSVVDLLIEDPTVMALSLAGEEKLLLAADTIDYQRSWGKPARINDIVKKGEEYFSAVRTLDDNTVLLGADEGRVVETCQNVLREKSKKIFAPEFEYPSDTEIFKELVIEFELEGIKCKALLDRLIVCHSKRWFVVEDFKTTRVKLPIFSGYTINTTRGTEHITGELYNRQIHRQTAFYTIAASTKFPGYTSKIPWILAQETEAPYRYNEYEIISQWHELGLRRIADATAIIRNHNLLDRGL